MIFGAHTILYSGNAEFTRLEEHGVECDAVSEQPWGHLTYLTLPSGAKLGLYQPLHPMAIRR